MQNEPQLSAEMEKRLYELAQEIGAQVTRDYKEKGGIWEGVSVSNQKSILKTSKQLQHFLATALEEQRLNYVRIIKSQREYYDFGRRGDETHLSGYLDGLDFTLDVLTQKKEDNEKI